MHKIFQKISKETFFSDYFQKKPLLIKGVFSVEDLPLTEMDSIASLVMEEECVSRLVIQKGKSWGMQFGPFSEKELNGLPSEKWTILAQRVNGFYPEAQDFLAEFSFLPGWCLDDLMISIAGNGGGVGPHLDRYDVFLIQASGKRLWKLGENLIPRGSAEAEFYPNMEVKILKNFTPHTEYLVEAGDVLYLPPRLAHDGVAVGNDCMTYSVGFRSPSMEEGMHFFSGLIDEEALISRLNWESLGQSNFLNSEDIKSIKNQLRKELELHLTDRNILQWLSTSRSGSQEIPPINTVDRKIHNQILRLNPLVSIVMADVEHNQIVFFANGTECRIPNHELSMKLLTEGKCDYSSFQNQSALCSWYEEALANDLIYIEGV